MTATWTLNATSAAQKSVAGTTTATRRLQTMRVAITLSPGAAAGGADTSPVQEFPRATMDTSSPSPAGHSRTT